MIIRNDECGYVMVLIYLQDVTVIFRRRGGDDLEQSYSKWAKTVEGAPDVINMTFTPIVSLLEGVTGIKHLTRAIELYLECKNSSFSVLIFPQYASFENPLRLCQKYVFRLKFIFVFYLMNSHSPRILYCVICIVCSDKPPIEDLQYFLDFQISRVWAPEHNSLQRKEPVCSSLQFSLMGPKLYISPDQVCINESFYSFLA